jgi:hypothetical protein
MRGYLPVTVEEIAAFLDSQTMECGPLYAPTIKFLTAHSEMDEEEGEFVLSMLAADEALEMRTKLQGPGFILALEVSDPEIVEHGENFIILKDLAKWESVQCAFLVSSDGEELTWFATQEIKSSLDNWMQG